MGFEAEGSPQEIQERITKLAEEYFSQQKNVEPGSLTTAGFVEEMDAYVEAIQNGNYSEPVHFVMERGGEQIQRDGKSVREYLSTALKKYEHYAGESSPLPEKRNDYQERADTVKQLLHDIEQLAGSNS